MSSNAEANPATGLGWKKYLFMAVGIILFIVVYYSPPWPDAIDPEGKAFALSPEGKGALAVFLLAATWWVTEVVPIGITAITIGPAAVMETIKKDCLAVGCDKAVIVDDGALAGADPFAIAQVLAAALKRDGYDLVLFGIKAIDDDSGQVGVMLAEKLGLRGAVRSYEVKHACYGGTLALRELLGRGTLLTQAELMLGETGRALELVVFPEYPGFLLAILPPGAFIGLGLLIAIKNHIDRRSVSSQAVIVTETPSETPAT